jgi:malate synthase
MEDAATAEIARVQLWQWVKYGSKTVSRPVLGCQSLLLPLHRPTQLLPHLPELSSASIPIRPADPTPQDSGKTITAAYLQPIFSEESSKVSKLPGIDSEHVKIASEYMIGQVKAQWPSDFLTSDLMGHLEGVGTAGTARKAAL